MQAPTTGPDYSPIGQRVIKSGIKEKGIPIGRAMKKAKNKRVIGHRFTKERACKCKQKELMDEAYRFRFVVEAGKAIVNKHIAADSLKNQLKPLTGPTSDPWRP